MKKLIFLSILLSLPISSLALDCEQHLSFTDRLKSQYPLKNVIVAEVTSVEKERFIEVEVEEWWKGYEAERFIKIDISATTVYEYEHNFQIGDRWVLQLRERGEALHLLFCTESALKIENGFVGWITPPQIYQFNYTRRMPFARFKRKSLQAIAQRDKDKLEE